MASFGIALILLFEAFKFIVAYTYSRSKSHTYRPHLITYYSFLLSYEYHLDQGVRTLKHNLLDWPWP